MDVNNSGSADSGVVMSDESVTEDDFVHISSDLDKKKCIITKVIFTQIEDKHCYPYDFHKLLLKHKGDVDLGRILSDEGYNLLHAVIVYNRLPFMLILVYHHIWNILSNGSVPPASETSFRGHTPEQVAESKKSKKYRVEYEKHDKLVKSLSPFLHACHQGDEKKVKQMLKQQRLLINDKDSFKNNCLHWVIVSGNLDLFMYLLDQGADVKIVNANKENLLHVACMLGQKQFVKVLMKKCRCDVTLSCTNKRTPLERVAENGDVETLKELFDCSVLPTACILPFAAAHGRFSFIKYVLEESKKYIDVDTRDNAGRSALMKACENGRLDIVIYMYSRGANLNATDFRKRTPLHIASEHGQMDIVQYLLDNKVDINPQDCYTGAELCFLIRGKDKGRKAWHYVEVRRNVVHTFLQKTKRGQVDVALYGSVVKSGWGDDPDKSVVEWIEKKFAERRNKPNAPPDVTPLHLAIYKEHPEVAELLIKSGVNIHITDQFGMTPLMFCALRDDMKTAQLLEDNGANVDAEDEHGHTALNIATTNENSKIQNFIEGKKHVELAIKFRDEALARLYDALQTEKLEELRQSGGNVKKYNIDVLRDGQIDINCVLVALGSGPIMKASGGDDDEGYVSAMSSLATNSSTGSASSYQNSLHLSVPGRNAALHTNQFPSSASSGYGSGQMESSS